MTVRIYELLSGALPASVCPECAALVWNTRKHDDWHASLPLNREQEMRKQRRT